MSWMKIWWTLVAANMRASMQYKWNFVLFTLLAAFVSVAEFLGLAVVLHAFGAIKGWSVWEIGYLYGLLMTCKYIYRGLASAVNNFEPYLVTGQLDQLLLRPLPVLLSLMTSRSRKVTGELLQSLAVLGVCIGVLLRDGQVSWWAVPQTMLAAATGTAIMFAVGLATAACGFWLTRIDDLYVLTDNATTTACQYPLSLFPAWLQSILIFVIPFGFINYMPALYIVKGQWGAWILALAAGVAAVSLTASLLLWRLGLTRYQSTGT